MGASSHLLDAEISSYESTEWRGTLGGRDVVIYARPLNSNDTTLVQRKYPGFPQTNQAEGMLELIIRKAVTENGDKHFDLADKPKLARVISDKIGEIFGALFSAQMTVETDEAFEERVKN